MPEPAWRRSSAAIGRRSHPCSTKCARPRATTLDEAALVDVLQRWIDEDRKAAPLKTLQGLIWREGYESGALVGHVYDDAVRDAAALARSAASPSLSIPRARWRPRSCCSATASPAT